VKSRDPDGFPDEAPESGAARGKGKRWGRAKPDRSEEIELQGEDLGWLDDLRSAKQDQADIGPDGTAPEAPLTARDEARRRELEALGQDEVELSTGDVRSRGRDRERTGLEPSGPDRDASPDRDDRLDRDGRSGGDGPLDRDGGLLDLDAGRRDRDRADRDLDRSDAGRSRFGGDQDRSGDDQIRSVEDLDPADDSSEWASRTGRRARREESPAPPSRAAPPPAVPVSPPPISPSAAPPAMTPSR
jgi:hypothetical protein